MEVIMSSSSTTTTVLISVGLIGFSFLFFHLYKIMVLKPEKLRSKLRAQGITGPPPSFLLGNLREMKGIKSKTLINSSEEEPVPPVRHDWATILFSCFERWRKTYGSTFICALGNIQVLYVIDPDMVKEIGLCTSLDLGNPSYLQTERGSLLGQSVLTVNGAMWVHQRKIIGPELYMDKVKGMVNLMVESAEVVFKTWENKIEGSKEGVVEIQRVDEDLRTLSADIISRACFGSNYSKGLEIFSRLRGIQQVMAKQTILMGVPGLRYLPTKNNREIWRLDKEVRSLILKVVKERTESSSDKDLLQKILQSANNINGELTRDTAEQLIVGNCKTFYFAGHESTALSASWSLIMLASNQEWQDRVRAEVLEITGGRLPDNDMLRKMKSLQMVIHETLRLYPTGVFLSREVLKEMTFGGIHVPKGVYIWVPVATLHHDPEIWGPDALEFNPGRFARGISSACKLPHVYMPFGMGPRTCLGENLALIELKVLLSLFVSKFSFSLSPNYRHCPVFNLVMEPGNGVHLLIKKL